MPLSLAAALVPALRLPLVVCDLGALALVAIDLLFTPRPERLGVARRLPRTAGLSNAFTRALVVDPAPAGGRASGLRFEVSEEFPACFEVVARSVATADGTQRAEPDRGDPSGGPDAGVLGDGELVLERDYRSRLRGVHALGDLRLRLRGPLGLVERTARMGGEQTIAIEPALAGLKRTLKLAASERWWELGVRKLRRRGGQTEFESLRQYVHGDDVRRIDWKAFAKRGRPTVRQYQEERGQELVLLIDSGRRMRATAAEDRLRGWNKLDWAIDAALELAAVALQKGDRVGIAVFDARIRAFVAPTRGARQLARLREAVFHLHPSEAESDLGRALREVAARYRRSAMVVVLSDVADPLSVDAQRRALASASKRHRLVFAGLDDPSLRRIADGLPAPRAEDADVLDEDPLPAVALRAAAFELIEDRRRALRRLAGSGVRVLDAVPAEAAGPLLAAWLDERRR